MTNKQKEELAKLFFDIGKLLFGSLVLSFFQSQLDITLVLLFSFMGLIFATGFFIMGLELLKEVY